MLAEYDKVWHRLSKPWCHWCDQENRVRKSHTFSCPWSTFPILPQGSGARGIDSLLAWSSSYALVVAGLTTWYTHLIPSRGAHKSIPLKEIVHSARNHCRVLWEIVQSSNVVLYVVNKLRSYCRVSHAYLSDLVSTPSGLGDIGVSASTYYFYACLRCFNISCVGYVIESVQPPSVDLGHQSSGCWKRINKQDVPENENLAQHNYGSLGSCGCISPWVSTRPAVLVSWRTQIAGRTRASGCRHSGTVGGQRRRIQWYTGRCERWWSVRTTLNYTSWSS